MKKLHLISVSILFAALCLAFTACNQGLTAGQGTGTVRIVIDNGASRAVNAEGMPVFDESNTTITVTGEDGNQLAEGKTSVTLQVPAGKKINIKVVVKTDAGEWRGTKEHTVTAGTNTVAVKLSKAPKSVGNVLIDVVKNDPHDTEITLKLAKAKGNVLAANVKINGNYLKQPVIARDGSGRIYMLYDKDGRKLTRFDAEGNIDTEFETKFGEIMPMLPPSVTISTMDTIAIDADKNYIFLFTGNYVYCFKEKEDHSFAYFVGTTFPNIAASLKVTAAAAYNGVLFAVYGDNLYACKFGFEDAPGHADIKLLKFDSQVSSKPLDKLRTEPTFGSNPTECTGLFADESGVYCLLREQKADASQLYMVGGLVHYTYSEGALENKTVKGLHAKAGGSDPSLTFKADAFVNPVCFVGYDEEYLYIADDGADISENTYIGISIAGNKNRIAKVKRGTLDLSFKDAEPRTTWFAEYTAQYAATIPTLLWSTNKGTRAVSLNLKIAGGTVKELVSNIRNQTTARDSTGAVYVLYKRGSDGELCLERFAADGTKDESFGTAKQGFTWPKKNDGTPDTDPSTGVSEIAVDFKTADVFLLKRIGTTITAYMAKKTDEGYTTFSAAQTVSTPGSPGNRSIDSVAAFGGTLFVAMDVQGTPDEKKLYAYKMETDSIGSFAFTGASADAELRALRAGATLDKRTCTGLFADGKGIYALLTQQDPYSGAAPYALGKVVRFGYDGTTLAEVSLTTSGNGGLNPDASGTGALVYNSAYLSNPAGFVGYDGDTLYIADDGVNIAYLNENYRIKGNEDRIMTFNRADNTVNASSISIDTETSWSEIYEAYNPNTKVLLWEKDFINIPPEYKGARYWVSNDGSTAYPGEDTALLIPSNSSNPITPTDVFCYDQDGNLYVLWEDGSNYKVRCFYLQPPATAEDKEGSYDKSILQDADLNLSAADKVDAIAVDISDGKNYLYCANNTTQKIQRYEWENSFGSAGLHSEFEISIGADDTVSALAANKDGVFVGVTEKYQDGTIDKYRLKVKKYAKTGKPATLGGEIMVGTAENTPTEPGGPSYPQSYQKIQKSINGLQVVDGVLYAITSRITQTYKDTSGNGDYECDGFRSDGFLYNVGNTTKDPFSGTAEELHKKEADNATQTGYGFYRFIAVKPKKLVIASDGAYGTGGAESSPTAKEDTNSVLEYDLAGRLQNEKNAGGAFSKQIGWDSSCGFAWE